MPLRISSTCIIELLTPVKPIPQPRSLPKRPIPPPRPPPRQLLKNVQADSTNTCDVAEPIEVDFFLNSNGTAVLTMNDKTISAEQEDQEKITMESLLETGISVSSCSKLLPSIPLGLPVSDNESDNSVIIIFCESSTLYIYTYF